MSTSAYLHNLRQALAQPGCPLCQILTGTATSFTDTLLYELVNDVEMRRELRRVMGFCREHVLLLVKPGASLGVSIISKDMLDHLLRLSQAGQFEASASLAFWQRRAKTGGEALAVDMSPQSPCPVCTHLQKTEAHYLEDLVKNLTGPDNLTAAYQSSDGLCLPHFKLALGYITDQATFTALIEAQNAVWQRLSSELGEFIRKNDYRFAREEVGKEGDAWLRAVEAISGVTPPELKR